MSQTTETKTAKITLTYEDATSRTYSFTDITNEAISNIPTKIKAINANMPANFKTTFRSNSGAPVMTIGKAQFIYETEDVIYGE